VVEDVVEPVVPVVEDVVEPVLEPVMDDGVDVVLPVLDPVLQSVAPIVADVPDVVPPALGPVLAPIAPIVDLPTVLLPPVPGLLGAVAPVPDGGDHQPPAEQLGPSPPSSTPPSPLDTATGPGSEPTGAGERFPLSGEAPAVSVSPGTTAALPALGASPEPMVAQGLPELKSEPQGAGVTPVSSPDPRGTLAAFALPCYAAAPMSGLAPLASWQTERVRASASGDGPTEIPSLPPPSSCSGTSGGSGAGFRTLFADLVTLAAFAAQPFSRRLQRASAPWRPAAFVAVIERPG
jgi:hypothetical protein